MNLKFGIVVFPGSNCDYDVYYVIKKILKFDASFLWHKNEITEHFDVIILPGGFSYGDYLRTGAIARFSPIMNSIINFANNGGIVLGICNGFQILLEAGLLPGVMLQNSKLNFICKDVYLKVENKNSIFTNSIPDHLNTLKIPIAHSDGNYFLNEEDFNDLVDNNQIIFRYSDKFGNITDEHNPNGSLLNIAAIINKQGNVLGMMPHPERACDSILKNTDGLFIFKSIVNYLTK